MKRSSVTASTPIHVAPSLFPSERAVATHDSAPKIPDPMMGTRKASCPDAS